MKLHKGNTNYCILFYFLLEEEDTPPGLLCRQVGLCLDRGCQFDSAKFIIGRVLELN